MKDKTVDIQVFLGEQGKSASLRVTTEELDRVKNEINLGARNFLTITDSENHAHVFNLSQVFAITRPGCNNLHDTVTPAQLAMQLHEKGMINDAELRTAFGLKGKVNKLSKSKMGLGKLKGN